MIKERRSESAVPMQGQCPAHPSIHFRIMDNRASWADGRAFFPRRGGWRFSNFHPSMARPNYRELTREQLIGLLEFINPEP